ncbi:B12-binding domain-containing radical SAM protein [Williamwhitmania taraxaci]|nr:B12-binding domain-containing radical SAM protein [Williamwhitmania taraxaci]
MNTSCDILLITPPLLQLNTPYPATAYLKGFLVDKGYRVDHADLGIETFVELLASDSLEQLFSGIVFEKISEQHLRQIYIQREAYIKFAPIIVQFLQGKNPELAHRIASRQYLPEANRFKAITDLEWAFGAHGVQEKAQHIATLFLEDLCTFIQETTSPNFELIRYAEKLSLYSPTFDKLLEQLQAPADPVMAIMESLLQIKVEEANPTVVGFTVPFPGNLLAALRGCQLIKREFPHITTLIGGGYPTTELRNLSDTRIFNFTDYIILDDGLSAIHAIAQRHIDKSEIAKLQSTWYLEAGKLTFTPEIKEDNAHFSEMPCPDFNGLPHHLYLSLLDGPNPMQQLWSNGRWNKLVLAHGCYWAKCTFCDTSLPYIGRFEPKTAIQIADEMEQVAKQTGSQGFHFVDEAAPPKLLKELSLEILQRGLAVSWWTNIRFEASFSADLCRLMAAAGCIAVSGGLEVASERILKLIKKGVTLSQAAQVTGNFSRAGIMVHAYLMYGFPTETLQETIDSLEVVRQLVQNNNVQSGFWHRFAMTEHSPIGINPDNFGTKRTTTCNQNVFANNEVPFSAKLDYNLEMIGEGLRTANYNYMLGLGFDVPLSKWFSGKTPQPTHAKNLIKNYTDSGLELIPTDYMKVIWLGGDVIQVKDGEITFAGKSGTQTIRCTQVQSEWLKGITKRITTRELEPMTYKTFKEDYIQCTGEPLEVLIFGKQGSILRKCGLLIF